MNKTHQSPEFTVIKQDQANAKFFVASFENRNPQQGTATPTQGAPSNTTSSMASSYGEDQGGFNF